MPLLDAILLRVPADFARRSGQDSHRLSHVYLTNNFDVVVKNPG